MVLWPRSSILSRQAEQEAQWQSKPREVRPFTGGTHAQCSPFADVNRAAGFYVDMLGFEKAWHAGDGAGKVCQVDHGECEIILREDATRRDKGRLFIELTADGVADLPCEFLEHAVPTKETWWGYDTLQVDDPDGNELLFPQPE